jgi:hypothetical protein
MTRLCNLTMPVRCCKLFTVELPFKSTVTSFSGKLDVNLVPRQRRIYRKDLQAYD